MNKWLMLALVAMLAGCTQSPEDISESAAEATAKQALQSFADSMETLDSNTISEVRGDFSIEDSGMSGGFSMLLEFGQADTMHMFIEIDSPMFGMSVDVYCLEDRMVFGYDGDIYEMRGSEDCELEDQGMDMDYSSEFLADFGFEEFDFADADIRSDGSMVVSMKHADGRATLTIDPQGRLVRMDIAADEMAGFFIISYGPRSVLQAPGETIRVPLSLDEDVDAVGNEYAWTAGHGESAPLAEFEVHLMRDGELLHSFPLGDFGQWGEYTYQFSDNGDGLLSWRDSFTITHASLDYYQWDLEIVVYDTWAGAAVNEEVFVPMGIELGLAAIIAVVLLRRRS